jgi:transcriptional regulator with XRE-family HTH domain
MSKRSGRWRLDANAIRIAMRAKGIATQGELARRIGVKPPSMSEWLNGKKPPSIQSLVTLCMELGISSDVALGLGSSDSPPEGEQEAKENTFTEAPIMETSDDERWKSLVEALVRAQADRDAAARRLSETIAGNTKTALQLSDLLMNSTPSREPSGRPGQDDP